MDGARCIEPSVMRSTYGGPALSFPTGRELTLPSWVAALAQAPQINGPQARRSTSVRTYGHPSKIPAQNIDRSQAKTLTVYTYS